MLACSNGFNQIAFELFRWHEIETLNPQHLSNINSSMLKSVELAKQNGYLQLSTDLKQLILDYETRRSSQLSDRKSSLSSTSVVSTTASSSSSPSFASELVNYQDSKTMPEMNLHNSYHLAVEHSILDDFHLIENLDDLNSLLLTDETTHSHLCELNDEQPQHAQENTENNSNNSELIFVSNVSEPVITNNIENSLILNTLEQNNSFNNHPHNQRSQVSDENDDYHNLFASFENTIVNLDDNCLNGLVENDLINTNSTNITMSSNKNEMNIDEQTINSNENLNTILHQPSSQLIMPINILSTNNVSSSLNTGPPSAPSSSLVDDDQDKKIKTLADNIIAAMPHKIKTNSYSTVISQQQQSNYKNFSVNSNSNKINGNIIIFH